MACKKRADAVGKPQSYIWSTRRSEQRLQSDSKAFPRASIQLSLRMNKASPAWMFDARMICVSARKSCVSDRSINQHASTTRSVTSSDSDGLWSGIGSAAGSSSGCVAAGGGSSITLTQPTVKPSRPNTSRMRNGEWGVRNPALRVMVASSPSVRCTAYMVHDWQGENKEL